MDSKVEELHSQAESLFAKFEQTGGGSCIDEVIALDREALQLCPLGRHRRTFALTSLSIHLHGRYTWLGVLRDLDEAISRGREALELCPQEHVGRAICLDILAAHLSTRCKKLGNMQDLEEAIVLGREALDLHPKERPDRSAPLNNLAIYLSIRYWRLGDTQDLEEAIVLSREALDLWPKGDPGRSMSLNNLASDLRTRYNQLGAMQDLEEAIVLGQEALDLLPKGNPSRPAYLITLAACFATRYNKLGAMQDLEQAIVLGRDTLGLRPKGHPDHSMSLSNLAHYLFTRYKQLKVIQDLEEAIAFDREALDLRPKGHPDRSMSLNNLALHVFTRYNQLGALQDLQEAISLSREALDLRPKGHPDRSMSLDNLAGDLCIRYNRLGTMEDLEEAIVLGREALDLRPKGQPDRSTSLNNLAAYFFTRHNKLRALQDLEEVIVLGREALDLCPQGHPHRSHFLENLANYLCTRFRQSGQLQDKEELFSLYSQLPFGNQFVLSCDISAVRAWAHAAEEFQHPSLLLAYESALRLLISHLASLPTLPQHHVVLKEVTSSFAVDAFSACLRNHAPTRAVELLEQGRGVFWTQLTRLHSPLHDVIESGPAGETLADQFTQLALHISSVLNAPSSDQHERLWQLNLKMQDIVMNIRKLPGLSRFQLPPLFSDLQRAAVGGPIIILNASKYSCDALIVFLDLDPVHIPLQITRDIVRDLSAELHSLTIRAKKEAMTTELARFLREVWDRIVFPIIDVLRTIVPPPSRIWWCPTAEFSLLPLHAAGPYRKGQQNLTDLYVSSYTPTLTSLIRARQGRFNFGPERKSFVAIGQSKASGETELHSVNAELENIEQLIGDRANFTRIDGELSCVSRVMEELGRNEWVHVACHGLPNRTRPFESAFALRDGRFEIQRMIGCKSRNAEFAYLSACHTTVGDEECPDEVIHLASAMQFIGFRSVIGTMWAVDDGETKKITSTFYRHMVDEYGRLDHTRAGYALHRTMEIEKDVPFDQRILYIHLGA